jgi:hypothetical protein
MIFGESNMGTLGNPGTKWMVYMEQIKQKNKDLQAVLDYHGTNCSCLSSLSPFSFVNVVNWTEYSN